MEIIAAFVIIAIGAMVQASIGFGLAIIAAPLLFGLSEHYVPGPISVLSLMLSIMLTYEYRASLSLKGLGSAVLGRVPGSLAGGVLLLWADPKSMSLWIGLSVLLAVVISLSNIHLSPTPRRMAFAGFLSGFMGTSTSIGGPPMALLMQHESAKYLRANLSAFFIFSVVLSIAVQIPTGHLGWSHLQMTLPLLPAPVLGYLVARRYGYLLSPDLIRMLSLGICAISGTLAVISYFV